MICGEKTYIYRKNAEINLGFFRKNRLGYEIYVFMATQQLSEF